MTLVELMIVLVVVGLLTALAFPSYQNAVQRSRRADAVAALTEIVQAQERWRASNPSYKAELTDPPLPGARTVSHDGHYTLSLTDVTASTYTAVATVRSESPQSSDSGCRVMRVVVNGGNITYTSTTTSNGGVDACWSK
jgi:type IV pilus assembly protein PilE